MFNKDYLVCSNSYSEVMNKTVIPWLESKEHTKFVSGYDSDPIFSVYYQAENPVGTVFIVHGFTENAYKYAELIYSLLHLHFSVVAYDHRGHGRSWREDGIPDPSVTHVNHFSDYVVDLRRIYEYYRAVMPLPHFVFAHSMGGAVAALFLEQYQDAFSAAVFSSPMIAPNIGGVPVFVASSMAAIAKKLGKQKDNPFFMKRYSGPEDFASSCATDPERFAWYDKIKSERTEFHNSVPSYQWSIESIKVTDMILAKGKPEKINCPVLLFSADRDSSVLPGPQTDFIHRVSDGTHIFVPGSKHEIYRSTNDILFPWWHQVISFFNSHTDLEAVELNRGEGTK
jgi:lysophospholipase